MAEENEELEPLAGDEALALFREGKDAWNAWASDPENRGRPVSFDNAKFPPDKEGLIDFNGFVFPGYAWFHDAVFNAQIQFNGVTFEDGALFAKATFRGNVNFYKPTFNGSVMFDDANFEGHTAFIEATFDGTVQFGRVRFKGNADFNRTTFEEVAWFDEAMFNSAASFQGTTFKKKAQFDRATFKWRPWFDGASFEDVVFLEDSEFLEVPDFRRTTFEKGVNLNRMAVSPGRVNVDSADKYRRLKKIAVEGKDHDREQYFFACELRAKRGFETRGLALVPNYLYEWTSDFGRSVWRPVLWLADVWLYFGLLYWWLSGREIEDLGYGFSYSASKLFPFIGASREMFSEARDTLFGKNAEVGLSVSSLSAIEGFLGIVFIFLIGLALRNRFRI